MDWSKCLVNAHSLLRCWVLGQCLRSCGQAITDSARDLWPWVDNHFAWSWLGATLVHLAAVLRCMANERKRLRPALDLGGNSAHALSGRSTNTTTVIPGRAITWCTSWLAILSRCSELRTVVDFALEDWLAQICGTDLKGEPCHKEEEIGALHCWQECVVQQTSILDGLS